MTMEKRKEKSVPAHTARGREKRNTGRSPFWTVALLVFFAVFCYASFRLSKDLLSDYRDKQGFKALSAIVAQSEEAARAAEPSPAPEATDTEAEEETGAAEEQKTEAPAEPKAEEAAEPKAEEAAGPQDEEPEEQKTGEAEEPEAVEPEEAAEPEDEEDEAQEPEPLPKYFQLHEENGDFFGWVRIEALEIDYPVMYSPERPEYYLDRDFYGYYSPSGVPFADDRCPEDGNYYLVYGHRMINGSMFGRLPEYAKEEFWEENPTIGFDTLYEEREYEVMSCFYSRLYAEGEPGFRFYDVFDLTEEEDFEHYVEEVKEAALYDTGVDAEFGDELLTLTTCSHHTDDGRFVVVAKRVK